MNRRGFAAIPVILVFLVLITAFALTYLASKPRLIPLPKDTETGQTTTSKKTVLLYVEASVDTLNGPVTLAKYPCTDPSSLAAKDTKAMESICIEDLKLSMIQRRRSLTSDNVLYFYDNDTNLLNIFDKNKKALHQISYATIDPSYKAVGKDSLYEPELLFATDNGVFITRAWGMTTFNNGVYYFDNTTGSSKAVLPTKQCEGDSCGLTGYDFLGVYKNSMYFSETDWDPANINLPGQGWNTIFQRIWRVDLSDRKQYVVLDTQRDSRVTKTLPLGVSSTGILYFARGDMMQPDDAITQVDKYYLLTDKYINFTDVEMSEANNASSDRFIYTRNISDSEIEKFVLFKTILKP